MAHHESNIAASTTWRSNARVLGYCLIVGLASTAFGFDSGLTSGFLAMPGWVKDFGDFEPALQSYVMKAGSITSMYGIEVAFAILASLASGYIGSRWGRKPGLIICALSGLLGSALQMIADWAAQLVGRAIMGASIGFAGNFTITFWSEVTPVSMRGLIVIFYNLFINVPSFIGSCVDEGTYRINNRWSYRTPLLVTMAAPLLLLVLIWFVPESPRWLVTRDRIEEARASISKIRGETIPVQELNREMDEVVAFTWLEKELEKSTSYLECFTGTHLRRTMIASLMIYGQQLMGISFITAYSTYFFALVGLDKPFVVTVIVNACQISGTLAAFVVIRFVGRRLTLILGAAVCCFSMLALSTIKQAAPNSVSAHRSVIAFICIFCFTYAASWGSISPVVMGEIPSNHLRSKTVSIALASGWVVSLVVVTSVPYLLSAAYANLGANVGFIFGALAVPVLIATILIVPETKDRTLEEIDEMFLNRVPVRKFKSYITTGQAAGYDVRDIMKDTATVTEVEKVESA